jgi:hypothetical protein
MSAASNESTLKIPRSPDVMSKNANAYTRSYRSESANTTGTHTAVNSNAPTPTPTPSSHHQTHIKQEHSASSKALSFQNASSKLSSKSLLLFRLVLQIMNFEPSRKKKLDEY